MKLQKAGVLLTFFVLSLSTTVFALTKPTKTQTTTQVKPVVIINVGITEYSKIQRTYNNYERLFSELAASADKNEPVTFKFAVGTYGEVLDWYNKGIIDVAILSAMPTGDLMLADEGSNLARAYIGDISVSGQRSPESILSLFPDRPNDPFVYKTGCIFLRSDQVLDDIAKEPDPWPKLKKLWEDGQLKFLFVRPYSLSGYIVPVKALRAHEIDPLKRQDQMDFTYDHSQSLNRLFSDPNATVPDPPHKVAFVLDDTRYLPETLDCKLPQQILPEQTFGRIRIKELDTFTIPREIVLANYNQERDEVSPSGGNKFTRTQALMKNVFRNWLSRVESHSLVKPATPDAPVIKYRSQPDIWQQGYDKVKDVLRGFSIPRELLNKSTLDDLMKDVSNSKSPRLALVLSGGGAKCAYQAGAIVAIENRLQQEVKKRQEKLSRCGLQGKSSTEREEAKNEIARKLDIHLVVGTSGGAINALLVAMRATGQPDARDALVGAWQSFKQQQFLQPSTRFRYWFGFCFGVFQTLLITVAVVLFGKQTMDWKWTMIVLAGLGCLELIPAFYFLTKMSIFWLYLIEAILLFGIVIVVLVFNLLIELAENAVRWRHNPPNGSAAQDVSDPKPKEVPEDPHRWRKLAIVLLVFFGTIEALFAKLPGSEKLLENLPDSHWVDHGWTAAVLLSTWSYPFPLLIGLFMALLGWSAIPIMRRFNWIKWRGSFVGWTAIVLVVIIILLVLEGLFRESSPSKVDGIEQAFLENVPVLIKKTVKSDFAYSPANDTQDSLGLLSRQIMTDHLLKRDLVITSSKLPVTENTVTLPVNNLPPDLYFYYRVNDEPTLKPPPDKSFVPLKYNRDRLLDVVIGSSTIYPIFPARTLKHINLGNEESQSTQIDEMRIIDGGFIHNIPIEAAKLWRATHIIVIEASPAEQYDPRDFLDHAMTAFGYLFAQAQRTDTLGSSAETFLLRPTSECDKSNVKSVCTEMDGKPEPDMDTFDFSRRAAKRAFDTGLDDVKSSKPLFVRISGEPHFQDVSVRAIRD